MSDEVTRQMREQREDAAGEAAWVKENVELRDELAELKEDRDRLLDQLTQMTRHRDEIKTQVEDLTANRDGLGRRVHETENDRDKWKMRTEKAESALEDLSAENADLVRAVNDQKQQAEHASATGDCLRKELEDAQNGCLKLGAEVIELREERDRWKIEAATRFNQITGLNTKVNELKEEISHLRGLRRQNDAVIKELRMLVVAGLKG